MANEATTFCLRDALYSLLSRTPLYNHLANGFPVNSRPILRKPDLVDKELFSMSTSSGLVEAAGIEFLDANGHVLVRNLFYGIHFHVPAAEINSQLNRSIEAFHKNGGDFSKIKTVVFRHTHPKVSGDEATWKFSPGDRKFAHGLLDVLRNEPSQLMKNVVVEMQMIYKDGSGMLSKKAFQLGN